MWRTKCLTWRNEIWTLTHFNEYRILSHLFHLERRSWWKPCRYPWILHRLKEIFCKFLNGVTFWSSTWVIIQIMFKIQSNLFATIYFRTLHLWPLLNVGRCSEVALSYKNSIREKKCSFLEKGSLAQFWLHLYFKCNSDVRYVTYGLQNLVNLS